MTLRLLLVLFFLNSSILFAQTDAYKAENNGYFAGLSKAKQRLILTDNFASQIFLLEDGELVSICESAGCGRYFEVSPDGSKIGYKLIKDDGQQYPAILDIDSRKTTVLSESHTLCGQISFSDNNLIAYSSDEKIIVQNTITKDISEIKINTYSNLTPISPDGNWVAYNNNRDQIFVININTKNVLQITDNKGGYVYPKWSPDSKKILFSSLGGNLYVYDFGLDKTYSIGRGGAAKWRGDSQCVLFQRTKANDFKFEGSELFLATYDAQKIWQLTNTTDTHEMNPIFLNNNKIAYNTYNKKTIQTADLTSKSYELENSETIYIDNGKTNVRYYALRNSRQDSTYIYDIPYVHQVYDTPNNFDGSGACAPATSIMAIAYYNKLPKWKTTVSLPYEHISDYGNYVADKYHYNENFYDDYASAYGTDSWGGYGFMWSGSYSPNSRMSQYISNHDISSNQLWTSSCTYDYTVNEINLGYPHAICTWITNSGHLKLVRGYIHNQHTLIFNDPFGDKNTPGYPSYDGINAKYDWPGYNNGYQNLDPTGSHGGIAWTVKTRGEHAEYQDTLIEDYYFNHGFEMFNEPPAHQQWFRDQNVGHENHCWWTNSMATSADVCFVRWRPNISTAGNYTIYAYVPEVVSEAENVIYKVFHGNGTDEVIIDQSDFSAEWVELGTYFLNSGTDNYVYLGDSTGISGQKIAFDAVMFSRSAISAGIPSSQNNHNLRIYPNPTKDIINIELPCKTNENVNFEFWDITGKLVYSVSKQISVGKTTINIENINGTGTFIIKIITKNDTWVSKIIKQ